MAPELILIPDADLMLTGATTIGPGYSKDHTEQQMRGWAQDLRTLQRTPAADLHALRSVPRDALTAPQQRVLSAEDNFYTEPVRGIQGDLRPDGSIELTGGHHRAAYLLDEAVDPLPVWVSGDAAQVQRLKDACQARSEARLDGPLRPKHVADRDAQRRADHDRPMSRERGRG